MAVALVVFNGTRINDSTANTDWGNFVIGGGAPASEAQLAYQGGSAVNKKVSSTVARQGVDYLVPAGSHDMTSAAKRLLFCKMIVSDSFDVNTTWGVEIAIGSADTSNSHRYNIADSGSNLAVYNDYPVQGGYILAAIDPTIDTWAETVDQGGAFDQTAVIWFAAGAQFVNGAAKTENLAFDAIDVGTGLTVTAGDGASPEGTFVDFVGFDQDIANNRYGVVFGAGDAVFALGVLTIGTASVTEFLDLDSVVTFPDGYHSRGLVGVAVGMSNVSSIIQIDSLLIGNGTRNGVDANDTRPDFTVTGTSGTFTCAATMRNFRDVTFTSVCDVDGADIECHLLTQATAEIQNSVIRTNALTSIACLQDPTFGATADLHDTEFIQAGAGHALEIDTAGSYTFTNLTFTGYGADTTDSAALDITAGTGTVTITLVGTAPTYKTAGATVVFNNDVTVTFDQLKDLTEVRIYDNTTGVELDGVEDAVAGAPGDRNFAASVAGGTVVDYVIHNKQYEYIRVEGFTWPSVAQTIIISQRFDRNYENP